MNIFSLPVNRNLSRFYILSVVVAILMTIASLAGSLFQSVIYPAEELRQPFVSNDIVNIFIGLPILIGSTVWARRSKLIGLLFLPGALFYVTYNYIAYTVAAPLSLLTVLYFVLVILSLYTLIGLLMGMDSTTIQSLLKGAVPERLSGGVLIGFGVLFILRSLGQLVSAFTGQATLNSPELGVLVADLLTVPTWVIGGILLWRRQSFGYVIGAGLLFQASMLFIGLLIFFILQPLLVQVPFPVSDFLVVLVMGLICFIPFGLFMHGMVTRA